MRYIFSLVFLLSVTLSATSQQINPVPDYIFRNSMSVGRNAPTDTSAYFSIGPRFGATRGFMPPMVVDTAAVTGTKRNGLLIYSIQRNSFLYWDSTGSRWSRIAANLDTILLSTRAWRQKGIDSVASVRIGGSGVTGYIPKFTAARTLDTTPIFQLGGLLGIGTTTPNQRVTIQQTTDSTHGLSIRDVSGRIFNLFYQNGNFNIGASNTGTQINIGSFNAGSSAGIVFYGKNNAVGAMSADGRLLIGKTTQATQELDVVGDMAVTEGASLATSSGSVGIGTTANATYKLDINGGTSTNILRLNTNGSNSAENKIEFSTLATLRSSISLANSSADLVFRNESAGGRNAGFQFWGGATPSQFMTLNNAGRLLLNTTTDAGYEFQVAGEGLFTSTYSNTSDGQIIANSSIPVINLRTTGNTGRFSITTNYNAANTTSFLGGTSNNNPTTEFMRFAHATGFMGIGGSTPNYLVTMNGTSTAALQQFILAGQGNTAADGALIGAERVGNDSVTLIVKNQENYPIMFYTNNTRQMTLSNAGELWVGYTTDQGAFSLQVNGVSLANGGYRSGAPNGGTAETWKLGIVVAGSYTAASNYLQVDVGGTLYYIGLVTPN